MYVLLRHEIYTGWSKSLCAPAFCIIIIRCTKTFDHPVCRTPRFSTVLKNPKGNWRLRATCSESRHMSIPVASPLRKTPSVYGIGAYSMWTPKPVRSSGDTSLYCLLFVVSYEVSYGANQQIDRDPSEHAVLYRNTVMRRLTTGIHY